MKSVLQVTSGPQGSERGGGTVPLPPCFLSCLSSSPLEVDQKRVSFQEAHLEQVCAVSVPDDPPSRCVLCLG